MKRLARMEASVLIGELIKIFSLFSIVVTVLNQYSSLETVIMLILITLCSFANDIARVKLQKLSRQLGYASFITSNILAGILLVKVYCIGTQIYIIILLVEILVSTRKIPIYVLCLHFCIFAASLIAGHTAIKAILSSYAIIVSIVYLFRNVLVEKAKTQTLNQELQIANGTLQEYSARIQELTISSERTRIAQELHDSLGHYLIALTMNLEYANAIIDREPQKAKPALNKSQELSKESILSLRKAVALLGGQRITQELRQSLQEIFANFQGVKDLQFELDLDDDIESENSELKNCLYRTVQESVTNGIKHGSATCFSIVIRKNDGQIYVYIQNNGVECKEIIKSKGIQGIENRIRDLGGEVGFYSGSSSGFYVEASIPSTTDNCRN